MKPIICLVVCLLSSGIKAQTNPLAAFDNLVNSTWISEGKQLGGHEGKTEKQFSLGLDGKLIKVITYTTDPQTLAFGLRNEGVRFFNKEKSEIEFYEFDKLGGVTKGSVKIEGKSIHYEYEYGEYLLRDSWIYISKDEYTFRVCSIKDGECDQIYHEAVFVRRD
ncbi:MAG: hypothetical protein HRT61_13870 [Ekhidna sp.]|nr:hypothetical protein [Ekhidna sp.]